MKTIANRFPWTVRLLALTAILMLASYRSWSQASNGPCGQTRHEYIEAGSMHYLPGEPVTITGNGFAPSCDVLMAANVPDGAIELGPATTDIEGNLTYTYLLGTVTGDYSIQAETTDGAISLATASFSSGIFVMTDKTDYQPGEAVTFSGRGFDPGETISLTVRQTYPGGVADRTLSAIANGSGAFANADLVVEEQDRNTALSVTATGQSSGRSAQAEFHDALAFIAGQKTANQTTATTQTSINATYAGGPTSGNFLVAVVGAFGDTTAITAPSGWSTAINQAGTLTTPAQGIFYKISAGAGDNSVTAGLSPSTTGTITIYEFSGVLTSGDPFDGANSNTGGSSQLSTTGTLTPTSASTTDLLIGGVSAESTTQTLAMSGTANNGFTKELPIATVNGGAVGAQRIATQSADKKSSPVGDSTGFNITGTGAPASILGWRGQIAAFKAKAATTTTISVSPATPVIVGASVTFTATVTSSSATGNVTFVDNVTTLCASAPVVSGVATCTTTSLAAGTHSAIKATYNGDADFAPSTSANLTPAYVVVAAATSDCFRSNIASGNWNVAGNWQAAKPVSGSCPTDPAAWVTSTLVPTNAASGIEIRSGHTITVSAAATARNLTVDSGGDLEVASGFTLTYGTAASNVMLINGVVGVSGTLNQQGSNDVEVGGTGTLTIKSGGLHNGGGGSGATVTFLLVDSGGQWTIDSGGSYAPTGTNAVNVKPGGTATLNGPVSAGDSVTLDGTVNASANISLTTISNLQIGGTVTMTAGTISVTRGNGGGMGSINSGGSLILQGSSIFALNGLGTSLYTVGSGGTLDMGPNALVNGASALVVNTGANLKIGSVDGITTGTTNGNIRTGGADVYNVGANYTYDGTAAQVTGNALPTSQVNSLTVNNSGGNVTLTNSVGVTGALNLTQGDLSTGSGANLLALQNATTCNGTTDVISLPGATGGVSRSAGGSLPTGTPLCYGNPNNQITINSGSSSALTVRLLKSVPAGKTDSVARNYQIIVSGTGLTTTLRLHYLDSELNGNAESALELWRAATAAGPFTNQGQTSRDGTANWVEKTGVSDTTLHGNWTFAASNATIKVTKVTVPAGGGPFTFTSADGGPAGSISDGGVLTATVVAGTYHSTETVPSDYTLTSIVCDAGATGDTGTATATFTVTAGQTVNCTFTDTKKGHLVVQKTTIPSGDPQSFSITASGSGTITGGGAGSVTDATDKDYEVTPGTYSVVETVPAGWTETSNTCSGVVVGAGATETCLITNTKKGHVVVTKVTDPASDPTLFNIHAEGTGTITPPANRTISTAAPEDFEVTPGTYRVAEFAQAGWDITGNTCQGLSVAAGATVNCTITNTKKGHLVVQKTTIPSGEAQSFSITASGSGTITGGGAGSVTDATDKDYEVTPGTYSVTETVPAGWTETSNTCSGVVVGAGATETCLITNTKKGHVVVTKVTNPAGDPTVFNIHAEGTGTITPPANRTLSTASPEDFEVTPGTYRVAEFAQTGWDITGNTCQGLVVAAGATVPCTITNTKKATLTVNKVTNPTSDTGLFNLQIDGTTYGSPADQGNGGTTGAVLLTPGLHTVSELAGTGTTLSDYTASFNGDCAPDGTITLAAGDNKVCSITNMKKPKLTVNKVTDPTSDPGLFNLQIDGTTYGPDQPNGGTTGAVSLDVVSQPDGRAAFGAGFATGQSFTATTTGLVTQIDVRSRTTTSSATLYIYNGNNGSGTPGSVGTPDYTQGSVSLTDATGDGSSFGFSSIVLTTPFAVTAGNQYSFAISGASLSGEVFNNPYSGGTKLDDYAGIAPNSDIAFQVISTHTVGETAGSGTDLADYTAVITGDCAADGSISLHPGDEKTCLITNTRKATIKVKKVTDPAGGGPFTFTSADGGPAGSISDGGELSATVVPGTYHSTETVPSDYTLTSIVCDAGGSGDTGTATATFTATAGSTISCTFTDVKKGHVVVTKVTDPVDNTTTFSLHAEGTGTITPPANRTIQSGTPQDFEVTPGTYRVAELAQAGWDQTGNTCHGLVVAAGATVPCTITNTKKGSIHIVKNTSGGDTTFNYTLAGPNSYSASPSVTTSGGTGDTTLTDVSAGSGYSASETVPAGWDLTASSCDNGTPASFAVPAGGTVTCTFTNVKKGHVIVTKVTDPALDPTVFNLHAEGTGTITPPANRTISTASPEDFEVTPGTYRVAEFAQAGWDITGNTCQGLVVAAGATQNCTITNTKKGSITVSKVTNPNDTVTGFSITASGSGTITAPATRTLKTGAPVTYEVSPGTYAVSEAPLAGWDETGNDCSSLVVAAGGSATCTITNTKKGHVVVTKVTNPANDPTLFSLHAEGTGTITPPANRTFSTAAPADFEVTPGTYRVAEFAQAGWDITGNTCQGLVVAAGATVNCTITNTQKGHLVVSKTTDNGDNSTAFTITASGTGTISPPNPTTITAAAAVSFEVSPGTYAVVETPQAGWVMSSNDCSGKVVPAGGTATCTIANKKDDDGDGIPNAIDCSPTVHDDVVVDPGNVVPPTFTGLKFATLQAAVIGASDNNVISMYANTTENVIIGSANGSGGKDLRIIGCGHKVTSAALQASNLPVITVQVSAGIAGDAANATGAETDIQIEDLSVLKGSIGLLIQTTKPGGVGTSTLLRSIRSDQNGPSNGTGNPTAGNPGHAIQIQGDGNEVRGANSLSTNSGDGINVTGNNNMLKTNKIQSNKSDGIDVTGGFNTITANGVGEKNLGNTLNGILVTGGHNTINENDVFHNKKTGINVAGDMNLVYKNDVGDKDKGNGTGVANVGGILITGDSNTLGLALNENNVFANIGIGVSVIGNFNNVSKNDVGDTGKGNTGIGINVNGKGNVLDQNNVFANGGDGIDIQGSASGTTSGMSNQNQVTNNTIGDRGKGNGGDGLMAGAATTEFGNVIHHNTIFANNKLGLNYKGSSGQIYANTIGDTSKGNVTGGVLLSGNSNVFGTATFPNLIFANTGTANGGLKVTGNSNSIVNNNIGDGGKGNGGDGINLNGNGNTIDQNLIYANTGDGIDVSGGTAASPNVVSNNKAGDVGKGNGGNGILFAGTGNGASAPTEITGNTTRSNTLNGIRISSGINNQVANNISGGTNSGQDNGDCEFLIVTGNINSGGNTANGVAVVGAFPTTCIGTQ